MNKLQKFMTENTEAKIVLQIEEIVREVNNTSLKKTKSSILEKLTGQLNELRENSEYSDKKIHEKLEKLLDKFKSLYVEIQTKQSKNKTIEVSLVDSNMETKSKQPVKKKDSIDTNKNDTKTVDENIKSKDSEKLNDQTKQIINNSLNKLDKESNNNPINNAIKDYKETHNAVSKNKIDNKNNENQNSDEENNEKTIDKSNSKDKKNNKTSNRKEKINEEHKYKTEKIEERKMQGRV